MEDKSEKKARREKRAEEERKAKDRARGSSGRSRAPPSMPDGKPSRGHDRSEEDRKAKDRARASGGARDRNRDRDREAKARARGSGGSSGATQVGAVAHRSRDDDRVSKKSSSHRSSGSSRTRDSPRTPRDRDEKAKERARRGGGSRQATPGAVAEKNGDNDDSLVSPRERSRRRKERQASGSARDSDSRRRERSRREKEKEATMNAVPPPPVQDGVATEEEVPTACAIDVETMEFEATTVPNITEEQLEAARREGREEGRNERDKHHEGDGDDDDDSVLEAAEEKKDNTTKKYAIAAFVVVLITAGIVIWRVMFSGKSDPAKVGPTIFTPPTEDDCLAVSQGLAVSGQDEASVRTFAVEMDLAVTSNMTLALLKSELEIRTQRYVLPLLIGCAVEDGPIVVQDNSFVITNANLELVTMDSPKSCNLGSQSLCSFTYMEIDLFLKDPEVSSDYILELIAFVFEHKGLLEVLDLLTPVEVIDTQREYEVLATAEPAPSSLPSSSPSITTSSPPTGLISDDTCRNIADGKSVDGQEDLVMQEYDISMDVMLALAMNDLTAITRELEERLQRFLMPLLVGCDPSLVLDQNENRRLTTAGLIRNALVEVEYLTSGMCLPESDPPCYHYVIHLDIWVSALVGSADFTEPLMEKFREEPLVPRLGFQSPFVRITVVDGVAQTPSAVPSFSPSANPTTQAPSQVPSVRPSASPSQVLSSNPSPQPTPRPTEQTSSPTPGPTKFPTPRPTKSPTKSPTKFPTPSPTKAPTRNPTAAPKPCIASDSDLYTAVNEYFDAYSPPPMAAPSPYYSYAPYAPTKQAVIDNHGPMSNWCFGPGVTSFAYLFTGSYTFNEDISKWDTSGITNMEWMFSYTAFNQNIGGWDTSKVTNMQYMFNGASAFNQDIKNWDVSKVTNMDSMFTGAAKFNQNIAIWDISSVTNLRYMFQNAESFNRNLCAWGDHLQSFPATSDSYGTSMFSNTLCPNPNIPDIYGYPPGPFCHTCY